MAIRAPYRSLRGISAVVALLAIGAVGCSDVSDAVDSAKDGAKSAARQRSVSSLDIGECYNPNSKAEGTVYFVEIVPCDEAHEVRSSASSPSTRARRTPATTRSR